MGLVHENGNIGYSDGDMRVVDGNGRLLADHRDPRPYWEYLGESVEPWSYLKSTYWKEFGYPDGLYRVGPLARLNVVDRLGTPEADDELQLYRDRLGRYPASSFYYHHARLIEILHCIHSIAENLSDPGILDDRVRAVAEPNRPEGVGVSEAPRGTLLHHYRVDENGSVQWANLIIATGHNNMAMNRGVLEVARKYVRGTQIPEGMLNRVEAVIRCYDPCLSCATHAIGQMPMQVELVDAGGTVVDKVHRGSAL
jgi:NAD-reducing hydrogenase large subunit